MIMDTPTIHPYHELLDSIPGNTKHLLLGNGFSIACDPVFSYEKLYDTAVAAGLSERAQLVFGKLGTNNFEGVMRLLDDANWVAEVYGLSPEGESEMLADVEIVKNTLVEAVSHSHLENAGSVPEEKKAAALRFLAPFHNVFTTNYDLLLCWVNMSAEPSPQWGDGFRAVEDDPDTPYVVFSERLGRNKGIFYLHGALHLYIDHGELRKHSWIRTGLPLTTLIRAGLSAKQYPLFVAEGSPEGKLEQIQRSGYLWYCLDKLAKVQGPLFVFGHMLGDSDSHIAKVLADNPKLPNMAVGIHGDPSTPGNQAIFHAVGQMIERRNQLILRKPRARSLEVSYFSSESANAWG